MDELDEAKTILMKATAAKDDAAIGRWKTRVADLEQSRGMKKLAKASDAVKTAKAPIPDEPGLGRVPIHGVEWAADAMMGMWDSGKEHELEGTTVASKATGGAIGGAIGGAVLPKTMEIAGKAIPGVLGKVVGGLGTAMGKIPLKERVLRGAGGGAVMGATDEVLDSFGVSPGTRGLVSLASGGIGEAGASFFAKEAGKMASIAGNLATGYAPGMARALQGMLSPNKTLNQETAALAQRRLFGEKTEGFRDLNVGVWNRTAAQEALRKADPYMFGPEGKPRPMPQGQAKNMPTEGVMADAPQLSGPKGQLEPRGNQTVEGKGDSKYQPSHQGVLETGDGAVTASTVYRTRLNEAVLNGVQSGKLFSRSKDFQALREELQAIAQTHPESKEQFQTLLQKLSTDRSPNLKVLKRYPDTVLEAVREWGKPLETGASFSGSRGVGTKTQLEVRSLIKDAYSKYAEQLTGEPLLDKYHHAYTVEKLAEAKDHFPAILKDQVTPADVKKFILNLKSDPEGSAFVTESTREFLANTAPDEIVRAFPKVEQLLLHSKLATPAGLAELRANVEEVGAIANKGLKQKAMQKIQFRMMGMMVQQGGMNTGEAFTAKYRELQDEAQYEK